MIRHIAKLVWNRKRSMSLLLVEIFLSFIVAFLVCDNMISGLFNYFSPLGYNYENLWDIRLESTTDRPFGKLSAEKAVQYGMLMNEIRSFAEVKEAEYIIGNIPYANLRVNNSLEYEGKTVFSGVSYVGDNYLKTMEMTLVEGRWFGPEDDGAAYEPLVIDETFKINLFGDGEALGKKIEDPTDEELEKSGAKYNIIGVVQTVRPRGELNDPEGEVFLRQKWDDSSHIPLAAMVRVGKGTSVSFEVQLQRRLAALAPDINFRIVPLAEARDAKLTEMGLVIILPIIVAVFLLFNVALGLFGIFWQAISRRRGEIGLRRALGADSRVIPLQIWGETVALGTMAILAGIPVVVNLAVLGVSKPIGSSIFFLALVCAGGMIYLILSICAVYPSFLAAQIQPAEALHSE